MDRRAFLAGAAAVALAPVSPAEMCAFRCTLDREPGDTIASMIEMVEGYFEGGRAVIRENGPDEWGIEVWYPT
jgi:hypothetical protein